MEEDKTMELESRVVTMMDAVERGDLDEMASCYASDAIQRHPLAPGDGPITGRAQIRASKVPLMQAFPDVTFKRKAALTSGSTVVIEGTLCATNTGALELSPGQQAPATGRSIEIPSVWVFEFNDDGLVAAERDYFDTASLHRQLHPQP